MWTAIVLCSVMAAVVVGQPGPDIFPRIDFNKDGHLTIDEFNKFYDSFDDDGDGHISLVDYMAATKLPKAQAQPLFNVYDTDKDGDLTKADTAVIFKRIDANGNNAITRGEMEHFVKGLQAVSSVGK